MKRSKLQTWHNKAIASKKERRGVLTTVYKTEQHTVSANGHILFCSNNETELKNDYSYGLNKTKNTPGDFEMMRRFPDFSVIIDNVEKVGNPQCEVDYDDIFQALTLCKVIDKLSITMTFEVNEIVFSAKGDNGTVEHTVKTNYCSKALWGDVAKYQVKFLLDALSGLKHQEKMIEMRFQQTFDKNNKPDGYILRIGKIDDRFAIIMPLTK